MDVDVFWQAIRQDRANGLPPAGIVICVAAILRTIDVQPCVNWHIRRVLYAH
jgi:hypothetical protein